MLAVPTLAGAVQGAPVGAGAGRAFAGWPAGASPQEIGRRLAESYLGRPLPAAPMHYAEACTWYGALAFARVAGDQGLDRRLVARFDPLLTPAGAAVLPA